MGADVGAERAAARVVCISRAFGSGGEAVGRIVSERLGFAYVDDEIVARAADRGGIDPELVADAEERRSLVTRLLEELGRLATPEVAAEALGGRGLAGSERYRSLIGEVIHETADRGEAVIVAHAASIALAGRPGLLRVLVTASPEARARWTAEAAETDYARALKLVAESDAARATYLKRFYGVERELPTHYDLVVNTETLGVDGAAALVLHAARPDLFVERGAAEAAAPPLNLAARPGSP